MNHTLDGEIGRMKALRALNPSVPQIEIDFLEQQKEQLQSAIDNSQLRLEAVRVIVAS